jgi:hypothetical protein
VLGRTGSGKTTFALWLLSGTNFDTQPWVILNTKGDKNINEIAAIPGVKTLDVSETPGERGLYVVNPTPKQGVELDAFLQRIWDKQNCGVFVDEVYMISPDDALNSCLTQGRSRRVPLIICSQRPAWCTRFVFSESEFVSLFNLQDREDRKSIARIVPVDRDYRLARFNSYWYDVGDERLVHFTPVPEMPAIIDTFRAKFPPNDAQEAGPLVAPYVKSPLPKRVI